MPEISRFYGIVIKMFFKPSTMEMTEGDLPRKAQELVKEWMKKNQDELLKMWDSQNLKKLPPLQ